MKGVVFLADNHNGSTFERPLTIGPFLDKHFKLRTDEGGMPFCAFNFIASNKQSIIDMNKCVFERYLSFAVKQSPKCQVRLVL